MTRHQNKKFIRWGIYTSNIAAFLFIAAFAGILSDHQGTIIAVVYVALTGLFSFAAFFLLLYLGLGPHIAYFLQRTVLPDDDANSNFPFPDLDDD